MVEMRRVNLGAEARYLPPKDGMKSAAYVRVAEPVSKLVNGQWEKQESRWFDAKFEGGWADKIHEEYKTGDALVVFGEVEKKVIEKDGQTYRSETLYVKGFGPDPLRMRLDIDRTSRGQTQRAEQDVEQEVAQQQAHEQTRQPSFAPAAEPQFPDPHSDPWSNVANIRDSVYGQSHAQGPSM